MLTIRTAHREDAPLLSEMGNASYRHHFAHLWHSASELAHFLQQEYSLPALHRSLADERSCWLIAEARHPGRLREIQLPSADSVRRSARHVAA